MQLHTLKSKTKRKISRQIGRGSKRGKTSGRGGKGQTARAGSKLRPEIREIIKKIPKLRGRGVNINKSFQIKPVVINISKLEGVKFEDNIVSPFNLVKAGVVEKKKGKVPEVKLLGEGDTSNLSSLSFKKMIYSKTAKEKIEKAGAKILQ